MSQRNAVRGRSRYPGTIDERLKSATFNALDYANCILWLSAANLVGVVEGSTVTAWPDSSGAGHHFNNSYGGAIYRALGANNRPYLESQGGSFYADTRVCPLSEFSLYFVGGPAGGHNGRMFGFENDGVGNSGLALYGSLMDIWIIRGGGATDDINGIGTSVGGTYLYTLLCGTGGTVARVNGVQKGSTSGTGWADAGVVGHVFSQGNAGGITGTRAKAYDIVIYSVKHDAPTLALVEAALMARYAL